MWSLKWIGVRIQTFNPHYKDAQYKDKIRYTDNLNSTAILSQEMTVNQKVCRNIIIIQYFNQHMFWIFGRITSTRRFYQISRTYFLWWWRNKNKTWHLFHVILFINNSFEQQIHFNGKIFRNNCCRCNEGSLYLKCLFQILDLSKTKIFGHLSNLPYFN